MPGRTIPAASPPWRQRLLATAERRLPALTRLKRRERLPVTLDRRRIYVLPTRFGLGFGVLLFVMLTGALNYGNNPAVLMTCLLGAAAWASLFAGFRTLAGLRLVAVSGGECHAGGTLPLSLAFDPAGRARASLRLRCGEIETAFALPVGDPATVMLDLPASRRGWFSPGRLRVWTEQPIGLFQAWSWLNPDVPLLVYPATETDPPPLPEAVARDGTPIGGRGDDEPAGLRPYRAGDPLRRIAWKASARHDDLLVRETESQRGDRLVLDWRRLDGLEREARIRRLTAWVLAAEQAQRAYTLRLPEAGFGPGLGAQHRHACLRALALLPHAAD